MNEKPILWIKFSKSLVQQLDYTHMTARRIPAATVLSKGGYHVYWVILAYWLAKGGYDINSVDKPPQILRSAAKKQVGARIDATDAEMLESLPGGATYQVYLAVTNYCQRLRAGSL